MNTDKHKNLYLISINVTNKLKERFFHEYVPEVLNVSQTTPTHDGHEGCLYLPWS